MYTPDTYISSISPKPSPNPLAYLEKKFNLTNDQVEKALQAVGGNKNAVEGFIQKNRGSLVRNNGA